MGALKKWGVGGGVTLDRARDTVGKEEILFMLDVVMMLIFRWTIKLGWPHQLPPRWWSGRLVWLLNNDEKNIWGKKKKTHAGFAITFIYWPRETFHILMFAHVRGLRAFIWPFSSLARPSASSSLSVLPLSVHFSCVCKNGGCVYVSSAWWSGRWKYEKQEICSCPCQFCSTELW